LRILHRISVPIVADFRDVSPERVYFRRVTVCLMTGIEMAPFSILVTQVWHLGMAALVSSRLSPLLTSLPN
jgi:hypothetical protein